MAEYDADSYLEALELPSIKIGGKSYTGRLLSLEEWLPFESQIRKLSSKNREEDIVDWEVYVSELAQMRSVLKQFFDAVFPTRIRSLLNPFRRTVAEQVMAMPPAELLRTARHFFEFQARGLDSMRALAKKESPSSGDPSEN